MCSNCERKARRDSHKPYRRGEVFISKLDMKIWGSVAPPVNRMTIICVELNEWGDIIGSEPVEMKMIDLQNISGKIIN